MPSGGQVCVSVVNGESTSYGVGLLEPRFDYLKNGRMLLPITSGRQESDERMHISHVAVMPDT